MDASAADWTLCALTVGEQLQLPEIRAALPVDEPYEGVRLEG